MYTTKVTSGEQFGYPPSYGDAYVTLQDETIIQLEFKNGCVENRTNPDGIFTRELVNSRRQVLVLT